MQNKIVQNVKDLLSTDGMVLHFLAVLKNLDFAYAGKGTTYITGQELSILHQGINATIEHYNKIN